MASATCKHVRDHRLSRAVASARTRVTFKFEDDFFCLMTHGDQVVTRNGASDRQGRVTLHHCLDLFLFYLERARRFERPTPTLARSGYARQRLLLAD